MDEEALRLAIDNYMKLNNNQRRAFNVRINGEEYTAKSRNGTAQIHFPVDGQLMQVSELAFKIIINDGVTQGGGGSSNECENWKYGVNLFKTYEEWRARYPVGDRVNIDCKFGCTCVDYASAFWVGQVNRKIVTGNGFAWGIWSLQRNTNMQGGFIPVYRWQDLQIGDWAVWGEIGTGHIAMATTCATSNVSPITFIEQSGTGSDAGSPVRLSSHSPTLPDGNKFLGAFRYTKWETPPCGTIA